MKKDSYLLYNGISIPKIMLGTYNIFGKEAKETFKSAYSIGYRGLDCGRYYKNECDWGLAIVEAGIPRKDIFIQTKVDYSKERKGLDIIKDFAITLNNFRTEYIDSLLIHWPVNETFINTWKALEELYNEGKVHAIGVCNFQIEHFKRLECFSHIKPMIAQFERHPLRKQEELYQYCKENQIQPEAYQPLAVCHPELFSDCVLKQIAESHNCSVPQVALAWNIQTGVIPLPRSRNMERLKQNFDSGNILLTGEEIAKINQDKKHYLRVMCESREFPGYWDDIHQVNVNDYLPNNSH